MVGHRLTPSIFDHQPDDHGLIGDVPVLRVTRQGAEAVHFVSSALEVGQEVQLKLDWERRFDHMQQHSGKSTDRIYCMCSAKLYNSASQKQLLVFMQYDLSGSFSIAYLKVQLHKS